LNGIRKKSSKGRKNRFFEDKYNNPQSALLSYFSLLFLPFVMPFTPQIPIANTQLTRISLQ